jgi:hypothetical protein
MAAIKRSLQNTAQQHATTRHNNTPQQHGTTTRHNNTAQQHATDKFTSHLRRKQDQLPIILNKF